jgi:hypothetical protein
MTPRGVRVAFCSIGGKVGAYFKHEYAHDCFCSLGTDSKMSREAQEARFQYDNKILEFINDAIDEKIAREREIK